MSKRKYPKIKISGRKGITIQLIAKRSGISYMLEDTGTHFVWSRVAWTGQKMWALPRVKTLAEAFEQVSDKTKYDVYFGGCDLYFVSVGQVGCYPDYWELFPTYREAEEDYRRYFADSERGLKDRLEEGIYKEDASFFAREDLMQYVLNWGERKMDDSHHPVIGTVNLNQATENVNA